jgi:hypothetical protein
MCTVIKVKRKITEDPADCLVLECKKRRKQLATDLLPATDAASSSPTHRIDSIKQILKYAGSAKNEVGHQALSRNCSRIFFPYFYINARHLCLFAKNEISERLIQLSANLKATVNNYIKNPKTPNKKSSKQDKLSMAKAETKSQRYVLLNKKRGIDSLDADTIEKITSQEGSIDKSELAINEYGDMNILDVVVSSYDTQEEAEKEKDSDASERIMCNGVELLKTKVFSNILISNSRIRQKSFKKENRTV